MSMSSPPAVRRYDHTTGTVLGSILRMGLPSMIGFAAMNVYDVVDMFWVARLGAESVAAVTIFFSFYWVISSANMIAGAGSLAIIARRYGEDDVPATEAAVREAILLKLALALVCGLAGLALLRPVLGLLGAAGEVADQARRYGGVQLLGLGFSFASWTVFTALRGVGDPAKAMFLMLSGVVLNLLLDPLLIFGWGVVPAMGVTGAAAASVISFATTFLAGLVIFFGGFTAIRLRWRDSRQISGARMLRMLRIGFPAGISALSFSLSRAVIMPMIAAFGPGVVAAYGMSNRVIALGIMVVVGMGLGVSALTGQNLGAGKPERAWSVAVLSTRLGAGVLGFFAIATLVLARPIAGLFFDAPSLVALGTTTLRVLALSLPFVGVFVPMENCCAGAGQNRVPMIFSILHAWLFLVPLIVLVTAVLKWNELAAWWSFVAAEALTAGLFLLYFRRRGWLATRV